MTFKRDKRISNADKPQRLFWFFLVVVLLCLFTYGYLVRATIVNIVERQNLERNLSALSSKVTSLEAQYVKTKNDVTLESAERLGFIAVSSQKFVTKTNSSGLSVNTR